MNLNKYNPLISYFLLPRFFLRIVVLELKIQKCLSRKWQDIEDHLIPLSWRGMFAVLSLQQILLALELNYYQLPCENFTYEDKVLDISL